MFRFECDGGGIEKENRVGSIRWTIKKDFFFLREYFERL
jgi:hypothetical protein